METYSDLVINCPEVTFQLVLHLTKGPDGATGSGAAAAEAGEGEHGGADEEVDEGDLTQQPVPITLPPAL